MDEPVRHQLREDQKPAAADPDDDFVVTAKDFPRITRKRGVMQGKACIRGMRVTVGMILRNLGGGVTVEELLEAYPYIERDDIMEALRYGAWLASERENQLDPVA